MAGTGTVTGVDVRSHQQNDISFCGMATAMMMLNVLDPANPRSEEFLRTQIRAKPDSSAPPLAMAEAIQTLKPTSNNVVFMDFPYGSWSAANDAIVRTLRDHHVPVAAQVWGRDHWNVVCAARTDVDPLPGARYILDGVFVNNPTPTQGGRMVHSDTDACGTGRGCGALHEFCSSDDWKTRLSGFAGAFECVTGAGPPPAGPPALGAAATFRGTDAAAAAIDGIAAFALDSNGPCAPFLRGAVADRVVSTPSPHGDFFLVDLLQSGTFTGRARVAADGTFLGVAVSGVEHAILTAAEIALIVANDLAAQPPFDDSGGDARSPRFARGPRVTGPFWRACLESPSPYYPLYEIEALDVAGRPRTMYADFQGRQYTVLHWFNVPPPASSPVVRKDRRGNYE